MDNKVMLSRIATERIKAIAILCVIVGHILGGVFGIISGHIQAILGTGGVNVFLILSGYGLYTSYLQKGVEIRTYWENKINKVFLPYAVITIAYYGFMLLINKEPGLMALVKNVLCIDYTRCMDGTMWYMSFLLLWYILFFITFYLRYPMFIKVTIMFVFAYVFHAGMFRNVFLDCNWQFTTNAYAFPAGIAIGYLINIINEFEKIKYTVKTNAKYIQMVMFAYGICCFLLGALQIAEISYLNYGLSYIVVLYPIFERFGHNSLFWKWTGLNSYELYLVEGKLITVVNTIGIFNNNFPLWMLLYIVTIVAVINIYKSIYPMAMDYIEKHNL